MSVVRILRLSVVLIPFLKPNWEERRKFLLSINHSKRFLMRCSVIFAKVEDNAMGLYACGSKGFLPGFRMGITIQDFHEFGTLPDSKHLLIKFRKQDKPLSFSLDKKEQGMPSSPGVESFRPLRAAWSSGREKGASISSLEGVGDKLRNKSTLEM